MAMHISNLVITGKKELPVLKITTLSDIKAAHAVNVIEEQKLKPKPKTSDYKYDLIKSHK